MWIFANTNAFHRLYNRHSSSRQFKFKFPPTKVDKSPRQNLAKYSLLLLEWLKIIVKPQLLAGAEYKKNCKQSNIYLPLVMSMSVAENNKHVITSSNPRLCIAKRLSVNITSYNFPAQVTIAYTLVTVIEE